MPSSAALIEPFTERLNTFVTDPRARGDLQRYFGISQPSGTPAYTGSRFEHLAGGETARTSPTGSPRRTSSRCKPCR